ncbi:hypothetical protein RUND412_007770 [Rhizina undulata]
MMDQHMPLEDMSGELEESAPEERPQCKQVAPQRYGNITEEELHELAAKRQETKRLAAAKRNLRSKQQTSIEKAKEDLGLQRKKTIFDGPSGSQNMGKGKGISRK